MAMTVGWDTSRIRTAPNVVSAEASIARLVAFALAARDARLEHIVGLTQWLASPSHPSSMTRQHWLVDRLFSMTPGVAHTIVSPGFFADAYLATMNLAVHLGVFPWIYGDSRNAPPSNEDIARVARSPGRRGDRYYIEDHKRGAFELGAAHAKPRRGRPAAAG